MLNYTKTFQYLVLLFCIISFALFLIEAGIKSLPQLQIILISVVIVGIILQWLFPSGDGEWFFLNLFGRIIAGLMIIGTLFIGSTSAFVWCAIWVTTPVPNPYPTMPIGETFLGIVAGFVLTTIVGIFYFWKLRVDDRAEKAFLLLLLICLVAFHILRE